MTLPLALDDFTRTGALGSQWTTAGGSFTCDGSRAYPASAATHSQGYLTASPNLSSSTPPKIRYEVDFTLPTPFPGSGLVRLGIVGLGGPLVCVYERTSGGAANQVQFAIRHPSTGAETSYFTAFAPGSFTALAAGATGRLRCDVTSYGALGLSVSAYLSTNAGTSFTGPLFTSTPTVAGWNTATGQSVTTMSSVSKCGGIIANVAGTNRAYLDNFRITDIGNLADSPTITTAYTLTAFPTLAAIAVSAEDDGTVQTLTVQPSYAMQVEDDWETVEHPYDGGYTATVAKQTVRRRKWHFHWDALDVTDVSAIAALRTAIRSRQSAFSWTDNVTSEALRIQFVEDPRVTLAGPGVWQADALVREVLSGA